MSKTVARLPEQFLSVDELADRLRVKRGTLYQQRHRRTCPGSLGVHAGGRLLFDPDLIARWLSEGGRPDWTPNGG
jgi:hypothetical protein